MKNVGREETVVAGIFACNCQILAQVGTSSFQMFINCFVPLEVSRGQTQQTKDAAHRCGEG